MSVTEPSVHEVLVALSRLADPELVEAEPERVLAETVGVALLVLPVAAEVSISVVQERVPHTPAASGPLATALDQAQYDAGDGPCLVAAARHETIHIADIETELRWPEFVAGARSHRVRSTLSLALPMPGSSKASVNLYATSSEAFDSTAVAVAQSVVDHTARTLSTLDTVRRHTAEARQMQQALESRAVIEQAKGYLAAQRGITTREAFTLLMQASSVNNRKVREIARDVMVSADGSRAGESLPLRRFG